MNSLPRNIEIDHDLPSPVEIDRAIEVATALKDAGRWDGECRICITDPIVSSVILHVEGTADRLIRGLDYYFPHEAE